MKKQFGKPIKSITYGGLEFKILFKILTKSTYPYILEENRVIEYRHRRIIERGLALLLIAHVILSYWPYAISTTTYLMNRVPTKVFFGLSPFEVLFDKSSFYRSLKTFGCQCFSYLR